MKIRDLIQEEIRRLTEGPPLTAQQRQTIFPAAQGDPNVDPYATAADPEAMKQFYRGGTQTTGFSGQPGDPPRTATEPMPYDPAIGATEPIMQFKGTELDPSRPGGTMAAAPVNPLFQGEPLSPEEPTVPGRPIKADQKIPSLRELVAQAIAKQRKK